MIQLFSLCITILMLCSKSIVVMATVRRNCEDWRLHRHTGKGYYRVDPTESGSSFEVECDLSSNPAKTIIHHDKETRTFFSRSSDGNYMTVDVTYWLALDKIDAVKTRASSCSQYVKMECFRNAIEFANNKAYWLGRHSEKYTYWGDVYGNNGYCECGLPATCEVLGDKCNCETSTLTWKYDEGHLVDMSALPLRQLRSDYLVNNAKGYHTIGPLICVDVDPRSWIETPAGVIITLILVVMTILSIIMSSLTCIRRKLWKQLSWKCKKKQSVTIVEPVGNAPRVILSEKPPSPLNTDSVKLYSASSRKPPMSPGIIPLDNYDTGKPPFPLNKANGSSDLYDVKSSSNFGRRFVQRVSSTSRMSYKTTINSPQPWEEGQGRFPWESNPPSRPPEYESLQYNEFEKPLSAKETNTN